MTDQKAQGKKKKKESYVFQCYKFMSNRSTFM